MRGIRQNYWLVVGFAVCLASGCASYDKQAQGTRGLAAGFGWNKSAAVAKSNAPANVRKKAESKPAANASSLANDKTNAAKQGEQSSATAGNANEEPFLLDTKLARSKSKSGTSDFPPMAEDRSSSNDVRIPQLPGDDKPAKITTREMNWQSKNKDGANSWSDSRKTAELQKPVPLADKGAPPARSLSDSNSLSQIPTARSKTTDPENDLNRPFAITTPRQLTESQKRAAGHANPFGDKPSVAKSDDFKLPPPIKFDEIPSQPSMRRQPSVVAENAATTVPIDKDVPARDPDGRLIPTVPALSRDKSLALRPAPFAPREGRGEMREDRALKRDDPTARRQELANANSSREDFLPKRAEPFLKRIDPPAKRDEPIVKREEPLLKRDEPFLKREEPLVKREDANAKRAEDMPLRSAPIVTTPTKQTIAAKPLVTAEPFKLPVAPSLPPSPNEKSDMSLSAPPTLGRTEIKKPVALSQPSAADSLPNAVKQEKTANPVIVTQPAPAAKSFTMDRLLFVQQVTSFGVYEPLPSSWISPGAEVLLYAEVQNFASQKTNEQYQTSIASRLRIETPQGDVVAQLDFDTIVDTCETTRKDFFCRYTFELPSKLVNGQRYVLRLLLRDLTGNQTAERTLEFTPTAP